LCAISETQRKIENMIKKTVFILLIILTNITYSQNDSIPGEAEYRKIYDCTYEEGNILIVQRKGKKLDYENSWKPSKEGFVMRMEGVYDLEFSDGKRYRSGVLKNISKDSVTISSTMNEKCAEYEGIKYELKTYPISSIKIARFISERALGFFSKKKLEKKYDLIVKKVDKAKLCPAVLTFTKRNNEVKVCHYYLTKQGYDILFETNGFLDYMEYPVNWK
jgi:hypothetical protein|tara:strand:- start:3024 stop:3683 length:660 start_codon:yes stop_codon:yes gene_type:complete